MKWSCTAQSFPQGSQSLAAPTAPGTRTHISGDHRLSAVPVFGSPFARSGKGGIRRSCNSSSSYRCSGTSAAATGTGPAAMAPGSAPHCYRARDGASTSVRSHLTTGCSSPLLTEYSAQPHVAGRLAGCCRCHRGSHHCFTVVMRSSGSDAAATAAVPPPPSEGPRVEEPSTALLLAWFACGNRSLFAAQCLVEVLMELYREGRSFEELQLSLKMVAQGSRLAGVPGTGVAAGEVILPPLLQPQDEDVLVSWVALVFLTLEELGVPRDKEPQERRQQEQERQGLRQGAAAGAAGGLPALIGAGLGSRGGGGMAAGSAYLRGMLGYVRQTLGMYDEGQTLARVAGLQGLVQQSVGPGASPFLVLMQQYTRLILLTVEVAATGGLVTARPLRPPETVTRPSGYSAAFSGSCSALDLYLDLDVGCGDAGGSAATSGAAAAAAAACPARALAVRLLMAFMGAVLGSGWSLRKFVEGVRVAYDQGLAADELFAQLDEQEFVQSGGLLPLAGASAAPASPPAPASEAAPLESPSAAATAEASAAAEGQPPLPAPAPQHQITKALLSTWISLSYMTLAQLAVPYPAAGERLGWAWAGFGDPIEALGMNDFVGNVLRQMAGEDPRAVPSPPPSPTCTPAPAPMAAPAGAEPEGWTGTGTAGTSATTSPPLLGDASLSSTLQAGTEAEAAAAAAVENSGPGVSPSPQSSEAVSGADGGGAPGGRWRGPPPLMVRVEDDSLPTTSTAFRVLSQQVALVQAVCRDVMREDRD